MTEAWGVEKDILTALSDPATSAEQLTQLTLKVRRWVYLLYVFSVIINEFFATLPNFLLEIGARSGAAF